MVLFPLSSLVSNFLSVGSVRILLSNFPGSPTRISTPRFFTTTAFLRFQVTCVSAPWILTTRSCAVCPAREIEEEPAALALQVVGMNLISALTARDSSIQFISEPSSITQVAGVVPSKAAIMGDFSFLTDLQLASRSSSFLKVFTTEKSEMGVELFEITGITSSEQLVLEGIGTELMLTLMLKLCCFSISGV